MADDDGPRRQIYIRAAYGKPLLTSVEEVHKLFEDTGKPTSVLNKWGEEPGPDGRLHELVLVTFKKNKALQRAVGMIGATLSEREVKIGINTRPPKARGQAAGSCRAFVGNLPFDADEELIKATFAQCGRILFVRFATDDSGSARGFCHVIFEDKDGKGTPAQLALSLGGTELKGRAISVAPAVAKEKKKRPPQQPKPEADRAAAEEAKKGKRPADWRHDRAAGLTLPRGPKKPRVEW